VHGNPHTYGVYQLLIFQSNLFAKDDYIIPKYKILIKPGSSNLPGRFADHNMIG
jgi:hypothetical protein